MKRQYTARCEHGFATVEEVKGTDQMGSVRTVMSGIKPQMRAQQIANLLNTAYQQGREDAAQEITDRFIALGCDVPQHVCLEPIGKFSLETEVAK